MNLSHFVWAILVITGFSFYTAQTASAQDAFIPDYQIERMNPGTGVADYIDVLSPVVVESLGFNAGGFLSYADDPLTIATPDSPQGNQVGSQTTLSIIGSMGFFNFMEVGILVPITLNQSGGSLVSVVGGRNAEREKLKSFGFNDPRLSLKFQILDTFTYPVGLGVALNGYFPLGTKRNLTSDGGFSVEGLLLTEVNIYRNIRAAANFGYRWRQYDRVFRDSHMGDDFVWGLAVSVPLWFSSFDFLAEFEGSLSLAKKPLGRKGTRPGEKPAEVRVAARWGIIKHLTLTAGVGTTMNSEGIGSPDFRFFLGLDGRWVLTDRFTGDIDYDADNIRGAADLCPELPEDYDGFEDDDGCPDPDNDGDGVEDALDECPNTPPGVRVDARGCPDNDRDGDGIPDDVDQCPEDPEDFDGFEDTDGCPDIDNDNDGIIDKQDVCPNEPETYNDFMDDDGCPDDPNARVHVGKDSLIIIEQVYFETAKAIIRDVSFSILDEVAKVLNENPQILLVRVEGHTDDRGDDDMNMTLSQDRANAVVDYLVEHGVERSRLEAVGYGETQPIADNETRAGRQQNRRVEFKMLKMKEY